MKRYAGKFKKVSCAECGKVYPEHSLEVHHVDGDHENNDLNNLKILCTICHRKHHFGRHESALTKTDDEQGSPKINWQGRLKKADSETNCEKAFTIEKDVLAALPSLYRDIWQFAIEKGMAILLE